MKRLFWIPINVLGAACIVFLYGGCGASEPRAYSVVTAQQGNAAAGSQEGATPDQINPLGPGLIGGFARGDEAWGAFLQNGRYRMATSSDFRFSAAALQQGGRDLKVWMQAPYIAGDIKGMGDGPNDVAVLVVDSEKSDSERMRLVIFSSLKNGEDLPKPSWLRCDRDLSQAYIDHNRDGFVLRFYREDGSFDACLIHWDKRIGQFDCVGRP